MSKPDTMPSHMKHAFERFPRHSGPARPASLMSHVKVPCLRLCCRFAATRLIRISVERMPRAGIEPAHPFGSRIFLPSAFAEKRHPSSRFLSRYGETSLRLSPPLSSSWSGSCLHLHHPQTVQGFTPAVIQILATPSLNRMRQRLVYDLYTFTSGFTRMT